MVKKVTIAKGVKVPERKAAMMRKKEGGSNVGRYATVAKKDFAGPKGGSPAGSFPIPNKKKAKSALKLAHNAPNPSGIKRAVYKKFPGLKKSKEQRQGKE